MLKKLYIKDYALIDELSVNLGPGLNILTGETGTGKSIIIGALSLLLGERTNTDVIRQGAKVAVVEGLFNVPSSLLIVLVKDLIQCTILLIGHDQHLIRRPCRTPAR